MNYPLLPYSRMVYEMIQKTPGVYDYKILLRAKESDADADLIEQSLRDAIRNHPVFTMHLCGEGHVMVQNGDEFSGQFHEFRVYVEDGNIYISAVINRILGDWSSIGILVNDFNRAYRREPMENDGYIEYLQKVEEYKGSGTYACHRASLEHDFAKVDYPVRPHTDIPLDTCIPVPAAGIFTDVFDAVTVASIDALLWEEHVTLTGFFVLCAALAVMDYEGTDSAALTWAYGGRDSLDEQNIYGSLHRDIPIRIDRCDDRKKLFRQVRDGIRSGIARSDYPITLTPPHSEIWNYAMNVLHQQDLTSFLNELPFPVEVVGTADVDGDIAYSLLDMEIYSGREIRLVYRYSASHYREESIRRFAELVRGYAERLPGIGNGRTTGLHHPVTARLAGMLASDRELESLMILSLEKASECSPDKQMNPVRSLEDLFLFLDSFLTCMPWESLGLGEDISLFRRIDQSTGYFLFLTDQPLTQLEGKGYLYPSIQYVPAISEWIREFNDAWRAFLDSGESWNEKHYEAVASEPLFGIGEGWYEDRFNWHTWNEFFARRLASPQARPVCGSAVVAPCDGILQPLMRIGADSRIDVPLSVCLKTASLRSVADLLGNSPFRNSFAGGLFLHQMLDFYDYHRFHSPVDGVVADIRKIDGINGSGGIVVWNAGRGRYEYSNPNEVGFQMIETRGVIVIETRGMGLVAVVPVGMAQVCSVNWAAGIGAGVSVRRGDELGYFLCGGSDVVLLFQKEIPLRLMAGTGSHVLMGTALFDFVDLQ